MGPNLSISSKTSIYFTKKAIRCINKLYYNGHTEPLFIRNKILKLDDLNTFELSKFMFDCINGILPTPILEYFITNATIHAHHTRQRNIPHVTQTFGTVSERSVTHKGPKTWREIRKQSDYIKTRISSLDYLKTITSPSTTKCTTYIIYWTAGNYHCPNWLSVLCMGVWWWWQCVSPRGWVCLCETRVFVCLLPVLMSCVRSCSGWVRPALSLWCSPVVLPRVSECARMGGGPSRSLSCLLWTSLCFIATTCKTRPAGRVRPATRFCPARKMFLNYNGNRPRHVIDHPYTTP